MSRNRPVQRRTSPNGSKSNKVTILGRRINKTKFRSAISMLALCFTIAAVAVIAILMFVLTPSDKEIMAQYEYGTFAEGISVNGVDVSGLTIAEAQELLLPAIEADLNTLNISVKHGNAQWAITSADIKATSNVVEVLEEAMLVGKDGTFFQNKSASNKASSEGMDFKTSFVPNENALKARVNSIAQHMGSLASRPSAIPNRMSPQPEFTFKDGSTGKVIDEEQLVSDITLSFEEHNYSAVLTPSLIDDPHSHTIEDVKANTKVRSSFITHFDTGAAKNAGRVRNIQKAADLLNGAVVQPGIEWSFNDFIGPRTEKGGWALAPGIVNGNQYEMQAGGGICQVSTTLYNALLGAGPEMEITVRKHHSWPSAYVDKGLDATVSTGGPDFAFINNTDYPLYIFAYADVVNYSITIYIYGQPLQEGVTYVCRGVTTQTLKAPAPKEVEDASLEVGTRQNDPNIKGRDGYVAEAYRDKYFNGQVVESELLYTDEYRAVQGVVLVGTKPKQN